MKEKSLKATHEGELTIGGTTIKCAVLEDGTRVLNRTTFIRAIGRKGKAKGGRDYDDEFRIPVFLTAKNLKPFIPEELLENSKPIIYQSKGGDVIGYKADLLPQTCYVFIDADEKNALNQNQRHIAEVCRILVRGFATVGITALVDEVTGFQYDRSRKALEEILDKFIAVELRKWAKTFPDEFYQRLFELRGWQYYPFGARRPALVGKLTNDIIYARLAPGVLEELRSKNPKNESGQRKHKYFQWLTEDVGHPRLREHIASVITLMRAASNWRNFTSLLNKSLPKYAETLPILFPDKDEETDD